MFYSGATPWHGLGTALPSNAKWGDVASMFPRVDERPLIVTGGAIVPDAKALISSDDGRYLATVGADYCVVQAETVATAIMNAAREAGAVFHTGGLLGDRGARGWLLGELPKAGFTVNGDNSPVRAYFLGYWGHDGKTAVTLKNVSTRVVCANTVAAALGERGAFKVSVRHTSGANQAVLQAGDQFASLYSSAKRLETFANAAAARTLNRDEVTAALDALFPVDKLAPIDGPEREKSDAGKASVLRLLQGQTVAPAHRATAWGLMQAASEHAEHMATRITDAQKQIDAIAARQLSAGLDSVASVYATVADVVGLQLGA